MQSAKFNESNAKLVSETCIQMQHETVELRDMSEHTKANMQTMIGRMTAPESYVEKAVENKIGVTSQKLQEMQEKVTETKE